jgi:hypothetical protein
MWLRCNQSPTVVNYSAILERNFMNTEPNDDTQSQLQPLGSLASRVAACIESQRTEQEQEIAYANLPEPAHTPADPGSTFARRVTQRIQQQRFENQ